MTHTRFPLALAAVMVAVTLGMPFPLYGQSYAAAAPARAAITDYVIGARDVLVITSYDDQLLSGRFGIDADGSFTFPMLGRVQAGGLTLRQVEGALRGGLIDRGFFKNPQLTVGVDQYRSQKIFILGQVRRPGVYALSGAMRLVEALALADSTLPTAKGEVVIVSAASDDDTDGHVVRVDLRELANGESAANVVLTGGETILVPRAENIYVFGQVKTPGAYPLPHQEMTVLQALSLAGGITDRGSDGRLQIVRIVDGKQRELKVDLGDRVLPGDTIVVPERLF